MSSLDPSNLKEAFHLLGNVLEHENAEPVRLVAVGGAALLATGVIS